ncbi:MAG: phosphoribosylaminoimidazolesuccinocarboxamide synthase [Candidatus Aenigmatarchaeota archaeon]
MKVLRIHEGSAKDTLIYNEPTEKEGEGVFEFLDYFSIFDWGRFLDSPIKFKGIAMAAIARKHFELLQKEGIKTHYLGMESPSRMKVAVVKIPEAYKNLAPGSRNCLLPIEIIFRIYTHPESSDLRKIKDGRRTFQELGYDEMPEPNKKLPSVKMSYSTKLEPEDRLLTREEARILAGLTQAEMDNLEALALKTNDIITKNSEAAGMIHYDGKIEVARDSEGEFMIVDVLGTLDEDRFMLDAGDGKFVDVSKQFLRNWYIANGWKAKADAAKKKADVGADWTTLCEPPPKLEKRISALMTEMYLADAETRTGEKIGDRLGVNVRTIKEVAREMLELQEAHNSGKLQL